jgi:inosine-uridine nucleoside N-ribohydrolase
MTRVIIDTDPGIDDLAAIFFALAFAGRGGAFQVEMLTTVFGNAAIHHTTRNALVLLETAGRSEIPVYVGAGRPLLRDPNLGTAIHGENGLGGIQVPAPTTQPQPGRAADRIVDAILAAPGEITLLALGPLTNVALALQLAPDIASAVREIVVMGGAVRVPGNVTSVATANLYNDPEAAAIVYKSGAPIVQVGMEVCVPTVITHAQLERLAGARNAMIDLLLAATPQIMGFYRASYGLETGVRYNDLVMMMRVLRPDLFGGVRLPVLVETAGTLTAGQTVPDWHGRWGMAPNTDIALEVDSAAIADLFVETLCAWSRPG